MLIGVGVDLMDVARMEAQCREGGADFLGRLFTPEEIAYCSGKRYPAQHFSARFAAKEALFKALGIGRDERLAWREVEIHNSASGKPEVRLHGRLSDTAHQRQVRAIHLSLSHTDQLAIAQLFLES
jgi:holo-[acyl-carrier protein] synthase